MLREREGGSVRSSEGETRPQRSMNELRRECGVCKKVIRAGTSGVKCTRCGVEVHKCCSGRSRWVTERTEWECEGCRGGGEREVVVVEKVSAGKCDECGRSRREGQGIECKGCGKVMHVMCAELGTRLQAARTNRREWRCKWCRAQRSER